MGPLLPVLLITLAVVCGHVVVLGPCCWVAQRARPPAARRQAQAARRTARARAEALLAAQLPPDEYAQLQREDYLDVASPTVPHRVYRIRRYCDLVDVYEAGQLELRLCVRPVARLPDADVVLTHKLMIAGDEGGYLRLANPVFVTRWC